MRYVPLNSFSFTLWMIAYKYDTNLVLIHVIHSINCCIEDAKCFILRQCEVSSWKENPAVCSWLPSATERKDPSKSRGLKLSREFERNPECLRLWSPCVLSWCDASWSAGKRKFMFGKGSKDWKYRTRNYVFIHFSTEPWFYSSSRNIFTKLARNISFFKYVLLCNGRVVLST